MNTAHARSRRDVTAISTPLPLWHGPLVADLSLASRSEPFSGTGWVFELKYDGFRLLAAKDGSAVTLRYRTGRDATAVFPEVVSAVAELPVRRALLDAEVVVFGDDGRSDFELLRARALRRGRPAHRAHLASACVFDLIALDHYDLRPLPLLVRKRALRDLIGSETRLRYVEHVATTGKQLFEGARDLHLEGVLAKRADSPYRPGRTGAWLKFKVEETADFVVIGIADPSDATFWRPSLVLGVVAREGIRYAGRVAVEPAEIDAVERVLPQLRRSSRPCIGSARAAVWMDPGIVCEVRFLASSQRGLRHPSFVRFRPDKAWRDCTNVMSGGSRGDPSSPAA